MVERDARVRRVADLQLLVGRDELRLGEPCHRERAILQHEQQLGIVVRVGLELGEQLGLCVVLVGIELEVHDVIDMYPGSSTNLLNDGAKYTDSAGVEAFQMLNTTSNRVERRMWNDYTTGRWQFEGEVQPFSPTDNECVMQIFGGTQAGATTQMIRAYAADNGSLRIGSTVIATNVWGKWTKINVIHDTTTNTVQTYVNGVLKNTKSGDAPGPWYHKYGDYGTVATGTAKVEWRNVAHYKK